MSIHKLLNLASFQSLWRGYEYHQDKAVLQSEWISDYEIFGSVKGSNNTVYEVCINLNHPKKSTCNCPHATGRQVLCKHKIALFFSEFPEYAEQYYDNIILAEEEAEEQAIELENKVIHYVHKLKKAELAELLLQMLFEGPEWQYERFIREHIEY